MFKKIKTMVLRNWISGILRPSKHVVMCQFFLIKGVQPNPLNLTRFAPSSVIDHRLLLLLFLLL